MPRTRTTNLLSSLNEKQQEAVRSTEGPVLIIAGAGSGKTRTLTHRIAYIIQEKGIPASNIIALTFTNKAAREMRERLASLVQNRTIPFMGTFHSFCVRILRQHGHHIGVSQTFTIYDTDQSKSLMKSIIIDHALSPKDVAPGSVLHTISAWKDNLYTPEERLESAEGLWEHRVAKLWQAYEKRQHEMTVLDFDSLLFFSVRLLRENKKIRKLLGSQYRYISVDEYQDTNHSQFMLLKLLTEQEQNICVVGDDAQAIYGWRGARIENIRSFPEQFPKCKIVTLDQSYRSTKAILASANNVIAQSTEAFKKELWTDNQEGSVPKRLYAEDEKDEGRRILEAFQRLFKNGLYAPNDAAILYRTNAQSRAIEEACLAQGIPYEIIGGLTFYERKEVKDILAYLRFLHNPKDELAFRRIANVPTRGIGDRSVEELLASTRTHGIDPLDPQAREHITPTRRQAIETLANIIIPIRNEISSLRPPEILDSLLKQLHFRDWLREESIRLYGSSESGERRFENVLELMTVAERHDTLETFLEELALISDIEKSSTKNTNQSRIKLMTIHAAKGLEFPIVAIAGMEEGLLPHQNALENSRATEEERRLCYVAMTRAKQELFLSNARTRRIYGTTIETYPSRFLDDIPEVHHGEFA